ncbi:VOC family protein [Shewanella bicestrii]|uniref:Glyoxalase n=2 Tax=Shewanella TaxID=22 RepID=A0A220ULI8_9GAMM|nr:MULTISPECIES: VOC family protein [Shewanella]QXN26480.1 VOC family protein [Shewanella putrefaciens]ASK68831.1 glyoxalase [Shewanella bicestrii]MCL1121635.1 VOC family protein [Shewanella seohaensis]MDH1470870.1 VOC family protein [Shewanella sp. GD03713]PWF64759.1 glyoxalase [Shewanella sp. BC20]
MDSAFNTAGALGWHELSTHDSEEAMRFYGEVFGWQFRTVKMPHGQYHLIENQGVGIGGITDNLIPALPCHWTGYVTVADVDIVAINAKKLGGDILFGPEDIPKVGRFCWIKDPQGAIIAAISYLSV